MKLDRNGQNPYTKYVDQVFAPEDSTLEQVRLALRANNKEGIHVSAHEGKLLQLLIKLVSARKVIEIGTLYAYSTLWMAQALPVDGKIYSLEKSEENFTKAQSFVQNSEAKNKVQILNGDASELLTQIEQEGPFDMIFIDANKGGYEGYLDWAEKNIRKGGLIIGDNTFLFGLVVDPACNKEFSQKAIEGMKNFNKRLADPKRYTSVLIPTVEGMTVALKNF